MEIIFDAIPPAMYAYIAGAGGGTLMLELRLLLPLLLLCTGGVVDNIIADIGERLESSMPDGHDGLAFDWAPEVNTQLLASTPLNERLLFVIDGCYSPGVVCHESLLPLFHGFENCGTRATLVEEY
jgi:hypothetical protein